MAGPYMPCVARPVQMGDKKKQAKLLSKPMNKIPIQRKNFLLQSFRSQLRQKQEEGPSKNASGVKPTWNQDDVDDVKLTSKRLQKHQKTVDEIEEAKLDYEILGSSSDEECVSVDSESESTASEEEENKKVEDEKREEEAMVKNPPLGAAAPGEGWANNIEKLAMEEILRDAKRAKDIASETGVWLKPAIPATNKRFLRNMLTSTLKAPLHLRQRPPRNDHWYMRPQSKHGEKLWEDRHQRHTVHKQHTEDEWREYRNSSYTGRRKRPRIEERICEKPSEERREGASERDKYERYKREQKRFQDESEKEYREMKEKHLQAGNEYRYDTGKKWREEEAREVEGSEEDQDGYLDFKDVYKDKETVKKMKKKKKDGSKKKSHKHRKHSKRKK